MARIEAQSKLGSHKVLDAFTPLTSGIEAALVKTLHPIEHISASIPLTSARRVHLAHRSGREMWGVATASPPMLFEEHSDASETVMAALAEPVDFPPLAAATVPGDRVAIALDEAVPCAASVVRGAVEAFRCAGVETHDISIVTAEQETSQQCREQFAANGYEMPRFVVHDPTDQSNLCLVGTTKRREPLLVNRTIFDADVVLPVGLARVGRSSVYDSLFPRFSDAATQQRYRTPTNLASATCVDEQAHETDEAGWLIGAPLVMQVVAGHGDRIAHVVAGDASAVARRSETLCRTRWSLHSPQRVSLVIAVVSGGARAQRWENVGRALAMAERVVAEDGAIAICSNLDCPPGSSLGRLIGCDDLKKVEQRILHDHHADSWPAWQLARALQRGPVYFLSQLEETIVEEMGLAPVADVSEIVRLAGRHESFVLVEDSQHAMVTVAGEGSH